MKTRSAVAALAALATLVGCGEGTLPPPPDIVLTNVRVVDVERGEALPPGTVAIRDGRIVSIYVPGAAGGAAAGAGAAADPGGAAADAQGAASRDAGYSMDGGGGYLIPGLWDMHVHFRGGEGLVAENRALLPLYIATGVTTVRDGGGDITPAVLEWRDEIEAGRLVGPRILTSGPKLDGPSGGWDGSIRLTEPGQVAAALDSLEAMGADYVKVYDGTIPGDVYLEIMREATRRGLVVTGHMPYSVNFQEAVAAGLDGTEHLYYAFKGSALNEDSVTAAIVEREGTNRPLGFWAALSLLIPSYDEDRARETFRTMAEAGTAAIPTLHIMQVLSWVDEVDHTADPELIWIDPAIEATYAGRVRSARGSSPAARAERRELQRLFTGMIQPMKEEGVMILAGSDAGPFNSYVYPGFALHSELEELVAAGLSPAEALRAATLDPARFMGKAEEFGLVEEGYRADLVLLGANPLEEIGNTRSIRAVIVGGREVLGPEELRGLLDGVARPPEE